jgi:hypothetical protein
MAWSEASPIDHVAPLQTGEPVAALSCPTASFCAGGGYGDVETTTDPTATHGPASGWQVLNVDGAYPSVSADPTINGIACPSAKLCVAVDSNGNVLTSDSPSGGLSTWTVTSEDRGEYLTSIACASAKLCVAVGRGPQGPKTLTSTDPGKGAAATWVAANESTFGSQGPNAIACPTAGLCVAVGSDDAGISTIWASNDPADGTAATWSLLEVGSVVGSDFLSVSCANTSTCVAVGTKGLVAASGNASSGTAVWHQTTVGGSDVVTVSCGSSTLCVGVDAAGSTITSTDPGQASPTWVEKPSVALEGQLISCPPATSLCVMSGGESKVLSSVDPADGTTAVWQTSGYTAFSQLVGVSCPSTSFCAAADGAGNVSTSTDPTGPAATWATTNVDPGLAINPGGSYGLEGISCPSADLCVAVDSVGNVLTSTDPGGNTPTWAIADVDHSGGFTAVTCRTAALCVAVDFAGDAVVSTNPTGGASAWTTTSISGGLLIHEAAVACPSATRCFATGGSGVTTITLTPSGTVSGSTTASVDLGINDLNGISCPTTSLCVAVDSAGNIEESTKPAGAASTWKRVKIDVAGASNPANPLDGLSCPTSNRCVAVDGAGDALDTSSPTGNASAWTVHHADDLGALNGVSCPSASQCVAVDAAGNEVTGSSRPVVTITPSKLSTGTIHARYHRKLSAHGGTAPYRWKKTSGTLPAGLTLSSAGTISGRPHTAGTSTFTVTASDSATPVVTASKTYRLTVHLAVHPVALPHGKVGSPYHQKLQASGGKHPYHWKRLSGSLPAGLSLSKSGAISGKPHKAGATTFTVKVTDSAKPSNTATEKYRLVVAKPH